MCPSSLNGHNLVFDTPLLRFTFSHKNVYLSAHFCVLDGTHPHPFDVHCPPLPCRRRVVVSVLLVVYTSSVPVSYCDVCTRPSPPCVHGVRTSWRMHGLTRSRVDGSLPHARSLRSSVYSVPLPRGPVSPHPGSVRPPVPSEGPPPL